MFPCLRKHFAKSKASSTQTLNSCLLNSTDLVGDYIVQEKHRIQDLLTTQPINLRSSCKQIKPGVDGMCLRVLFLQKESFAPDYFDVNFDTLGQWDFYIIEPSQRACNGSF